MAKGVKVTIGEKERTLKFPLMAIIKLDKDFGVKLTDLQDEEKAQDLETILAIIYSGLIHEDKDLSYEELGYMIEINELPHIAEKLSEAFKDVKEKN